MLPCICLSFPEPEVLTAPYGFYSLVPTEISNLAYKESRPYLSKSQLNMTLKEISS